MLLFQFGAGKNSRDLIKVLVTRTPRRSKTLGIYIKLIIEK